LAVIVQPDIPCRCSFVYLADLPFYAGIYVDPDIGGTGLTRKDAAVIFEALATVFSLL